MSIHPSLLPTKGKKQRSVLKRYERVDELKKEGKWQEENAIFGLPKGKIIKLKLKKAKAAEPKTAEGEKKAPEKEAAAKPAPKK